jgi:hypothetical protein
MSEEIKCGTFKDPSEFPADVRATLDAAREEMLKDSIIDIATEGGRLLPCPFCGGAASAYERSQRSHRNGQWGRTSYFGVRCDGKCPYQGYLEVPRVSHCESAEEAALLWNRRAVLDAGEREARLREALDALHDAAAAASVAWVFTKPSDESNDINGFCKAMRGLIPALEKSDAALSPEPRK